MRTTPETLKSDEFGAHLHHPRVHKLDDTAWPSSPYGAAKLLGESMCRFYALTRGLSCFVLRIGWLIAEDDPRCVGPAEVDFMRGLYLSHRDAGNIFWQAATLPLDAKLPYSIAYATSNNGRSMLDRDTSFARLQYTSKDNAETFFSPHK